MSKIIEISNVVHSYTGSKVLNNLTLSIETGEFVCLLGPSGCGKTTTLKILSGLETPQQGTVSINGQVVVENGRNIIPPEKRGLGVVFQDFALFPHLTVAENIGFGLKGCSSTHCSCEINKALKYVDMTAFKEVYPSELSGGQQQRVSLARAIAPSPNLVLLDEPFSHLDSRLKETMRDQTLHVLKSVGAAGLMVTHDPEEAMFMADKIVVMNEGLIVQVGSPKDLYLNPASPFIAKFFGDVNSIFGVVKGEKIETAIGQVDATGLADGVNVHIMIRPEGIDFVKKNGKNNHIVSVEEVRMLGMTSLVHMNYVNEQGKTVHLHSRVYGQDLPNVGDSVAVNLKSEHTFVFVVE